MAKPKISSDWMCGCAGCHMSLLDIDERIIQMLAAYAAVAIHNARLYRDLHNALRQEQEVRARLAGLSPARAGSRYAPGKWSVREVLGHVIDTERVFGYRALCVCVDRNYYGRRERDLISRANVREGFGDPSFQQALCWDDLIWMKERTKLPLILKGDWNDGLNAVGAGGSGESMWMASFLYFLLREWARLPFVDPDTRKRFEEEAEELRQAANQYGWDGGWYWRATTDDGDAQVSKLVGQLARDFEAVGCGHARTNHGDRVLVLWQQSAFDVENDWRVVDLTQQSRVFFVLLHDDAATEIIDALELGGKINGFLPIHNCLRGVGAEALDDRGAGERRVRQPAAADARAPALDQLHREAVRVRGERMVEHQPGELPVAGGAVLPRARRLRRAEGRRRHPRRRKPGERRAIPDPEPFEARQVDAARGAEHVAEGVAPRVAVGGGVVRRADAEAVEHHDRRAARHLSARCPGRTGTGARSAPGSAAALRRGRAGRPSCSRASRECR